jgi:UDP:flavonoid glycosyltransferase YjiC (YdhE family)
VYISLGTLWYETPGVMETIVTALSAEPLELIVFPGDERAAERLRSVVAAMPPHPARVMIDPSVAQLAALRRSDVFVTHSGMNSVRESLILGVPMIGVPIRGDQMFNAARCEAVGVGRCVPAHELRAELVGDAVRSVRDVPAYRAASARLRDSVAALPPIARAVYLLEELVQTGRPITRPGDRHRRA